MILNHRNNRNFDYFSPKFSYFNTSRILLIDFIEISIKSTRLILIIPTNTSKIEPIKAGFSTNDKYQKPHVLGSKVIYNIYKDPAQGLTLLAG